MEYSAFIIGILLVMVIIMSNKLSELKNQLYRTNKILEKMALQLGVEQLDYIDDEEALESVKDLVKAGKKITAVNKYRMATGKEIEEARDKIDELYETLMEKGEI